MKESRETIFCHIKRPSEQLLKNIYIQSVHTSTIRTVSASLALILSSFALALRLFRLPLLLCISQSLWPISCWHLMLGSEVISELCYWFSLHALENPSATFIKTKGLSQLSFVPRYNTTRYSLLSPSSPYSLFCHVYPRVHSL